MSQHQVTPDEVRAAVAGSLREHWTFFLIEGIVLAILGTLAVIVPPLATIALTIVFGWIILASGVMGLIMTFAARGAPGFWWSLVSAIIAIAAGLILLIEPMRGALSLTLLLTAFFIVEGVVSIFYALQHRNELTGRWEWMLISGLIDLVLAAMILVGFPGTAAWAIGLLVGVNMMFGGAALVAMALAARQAR